MTATNAACCGNCHHWAPNYEPTALQLSEAPWQSLPVVKEPSWGWCTKGVPGNWLGYKSHRMKSLQGAGTETHFEGACDEHLDKPSMPPSHGSPFSESAD